MAYVAGPLLFHAYRFKWNEEHFQGIISCPLGSQTSDNLCNQNHLTDAWLYAYTYKLIKQ